MRTGSAGASSVLVVLLLTAEAFGQNQDPAPSASSSSVPTPAPPLAAAREQEAAPASPSTSVAAAAPPPPTGAGTTTASPRPRHGGFYLRLSTQVVSYFWITGTGPYGSASVSNVGGPVGEFAIGGTLAPGLALAGHVATSNGGGHFNGGPFMNATVTTAMQPGSSTPASSSAGMTLYDLGLLVDWFPNPAGGFHIGGALGLGNLTMSNSADGSSFGGEGVAWSVFGGYAFWLGRSWSLGVDLAVRGIAPQVDLTDSSGADSGYRMTPVMIGSEWSVLYY